MLGKCELARGNPTYYTKSRPLTVSAHQILLFPLFGFMASLVLAIINELKKFSSMA